MERLVRAGLGAVVARLEELTERIERLESAVIRLVGTSGPPLRPVPPAATDPPLRPAPYQREPALARPSSRPSAPPVPPDAPPPRIDETLIWGQPSTDPKEPPPVSGTFAASVEDEDHRRSGLFRRRKDAEPPTD